MSHYRLIRRSLLLLLLLPLALLLLTVVAGAVGGLVGPSSDKAPLQVLKVAPLDGQPSPLLPLTQGHIADVSRPEETYRFPVPLGGIGPVEPLFAGPLQYPFHCTSEKQGLGQPEVDNQQGFGVPVYQLDENGRKTEQVAGYSKDCLIRSQLRYFYQRRGSHNFHQYHPDNPPPAEQIVHISHPTDPERGEVPFVVRLEQGSINRFIYSIAMLADVSAAPERVSHDMWSGRLIYRFDGGIGIGFTQGKVRVGGELRDRAQQLAAGYAMVSSSGNRTSHTYNALLQEDTARRVKQHFVSLYGEPLYTVGLGASGGGIQQYLLSQNAPGLLDGGIPLYSYPDMVSQTIYGLDCDLFESYFLYRADDKSRWQDFKQRQAVLGLNSFNGEGHPLVKVVQPVNQLLSGNLPTLPKGNSECHSGWIGMSSLVHNPHQGYLKPDYSQQVVESTEWSYWNDLRQIFGEDEAGFARTTWDNEGVQYGLEALKEGRLPPEVFIELNQRIGSWVPQQQMKPESGVSLFKPEWLLWISYPGRQNITKPEDKLAAAPRYRADRGAIEAAYRSGQVFLGRLNIPMLDVRHYLEHRLDMHHISASFNTRQRLLREQGHSDNLVIWISHEDHNPVDQALETMDRWLVESEKPLDSCLDQHGRVIAEGKSVWNGPWNDRPRGACTSQFPAFSTSRIEAGAPWSGDIFQCVRVPISEAIERGFYGEQDMRPWQPVLEQVFASGVCDWSQGDAARPLDI